MSIFTDLTGTTLLRMFDKAIEQKKIRWSVTHLGKLELTQSGLGPTNWVFSGERIPWHRCSFDMAVLFNIISLQMPLPFVPSRCHGCWKVWAHPKTLRDVWDIHEFQKELVKEHGNYCKVGTDTREKSHALYTCIYYASSKEEALAMRDIVQSHFPHIEHQVKRSCSELEMACGDSMNWQIYPGQIEMEEKIDSMVVVDEMVGAGQPDWLKDWLKFNWIMYAWSIGDPTVYDFTDGKPIYPVQRNYD